MKEIYDLYEKCVNYMSDDDTNTAKEIIEQAIEQQESDADEIVEELSEELGECLDC